MEGPEAGDVVQRGRLRGRRVASHLLPPLLGRGFAEYLTGRRDLRAGGK